MSGKTKTENNVPAVEPEEDRVKPIVFQVADVPEPLRVRFKVACAEKGKTMRQTIIELMQNFVKEGR